MSEPQYRRVDEVVSAACAALFPGELVMAEDMDLDMAMSALEIMDPKMDAGCARHAQQAEALESALESGAINTTKLSSEEAAEALDALLQMILSWFDGRPLSQTIYSCAYMHAEVQQALEDHLVQTDVKRDPGNDFATRMMLGYCRLVHTSCCLAHQAVIEANIYMEEDYADSHAAPLKLLGKSTMDMADIKAQLEVAAKWDIQLDQRPASTKANGGGKANGISGDDRLVQHFKLLYTFVQLQFHLHCSQMGLATPVSSESRSNQDHGVRTKFLVEACKSHAKQLVRPVETPSEAGGGIAEAGDKSATNTTKHAGGGGSGIGNVNSDGEAVKKDEETEETGPKATSFVAAYGFKLASGLPGFYERPERRGPSQKVMKPLDDMLDILLDLGALGRQPTDTEHSELPNRDEPDAVGKFKPTTLQQLRIRFEALAARDANVYCRSAALLSVFGNDAEVIFGNMSVMKFMANSEHAFGSSPRATRSEAGQNHLACLVKPAYDSLRCLCENPARQWRNIPKLFTDFASMQSDAELYDHHLKSTLSRTAMSLQEQRRFEERQKQRHQGPVREQPSSFGIFFLDHYMCMQLHWLLTGFDAGLYAAAEYAAVYRYLDFLNGMRVSNLDTARRVLNGRSYADVALAQEEAEKEAAAQQKTAAASAGGGGQNSTNNSNRKSKKKKGKGKKGKGKGKKGPSQQRGQGSKPSVQTAPVSLRQRLELERRWEGVTALRNADLVVEQVRCQARRGLCRGLFHVCIFLQSYNFRAFGGIPGSAGAAMQSLPGSERSRYEHRLGDLIWGALDENGHPHHNALPALTYEDFVCGVCPSLDPELPLAGQLAQREDIAEQRKGHLNNATKCFSTSRSSVGQLLSSIASKDPVEVAEWKALKRVAVVNSVFVMQLQKALASAQEKAEAAGEDPAVAIDDVIQRVAIVNEGLPRGALPRYASFKLDPPTTNTK